jgi:ubiquinone/menaquinone biosynthesis C-methylase UbiE
MGILQSKAFDERFYTEHAKWGIDFAVYGQWQQQYGRWIVDALQLQGKRVLDVGCACGSIALGLLEAGADVTGVDLSEYMIQLGRERFPALRTRLHICDAVNLHIVNDESFDFIHIQQVAEHWQPLLVIPTLHELYRVTVPGGLLLSFHATLEEYIRRGRIQSMSQRWEHDDPTHVSLREADYWTKMLFQTRWAVAPALRGQLENHPLSMLEKEQWDYEIARRGN